MLWTLGCVYLFKLVFGVLGDKNLGVELLSHMVVLFLVFWELACFPQWLHQLTFPLMCIAMASKVVLCYVALVIKWHRRHGFNPCVRKIPWRRAWQPSPIFLQTEESGRLQSIELQRVEHDWSDLAQQCTRIPFF